MIVDKDMITGHKNTNYDSQSVQNFQEYYNNITLEDQRMAMTSNEATIDTNFNLQNNIHIEELSHWNIKRKRSNLLQGVI